MFSLWHKTGPHWAPTVTPAFAVLLLQQTSLELCRDRDRCLSTVEHTNPTPMWMWADVQPWPYHTREKHTPTGRIKFPYSIFPSFPISPTSVPEWHYPCPGASSGITCIILVWFWPQTSCSPARAGVPSGSETRRVCLQQLPCTMMIRKGRWNWEEVQGVPHYHKCCPLLLQQVVYKSLCK